MNIKNFIEKTGKTDSQIILKNTLTFKTYLPLSEKRALAKRIVARSIINDNGYVIIDEISKYLIFTIEVLSAYTDLIFDEDLEVASKEYDMLVENNKINLLISQFESEYKIMLELVRMEVDTVMQKNTVQYQTAQFFNGLNGIISGLADSLMAKVNSFNFEDLGISFEDLSKLNTFMNKYVK